MIRKLLCWLGWHEYRPIKNIDEFYDKFCRTCEFHNGDCNACWCYENFGKDKEICKHCGAIKK